MVVDEQDLDSHHVRLKSEAKAGPPPEFGRDVFRVRAHPVAASLVSVISRHGAGNKDTGESTLCVFIVTSDAAMRRGLALRLDGEPDMTVIGTAASPAQAPADASVPTVIVLGVRRGDPAVDDAIVGLCTRPLGPPVVLLGLDSGAGSVAGRPFVSMHDGDATLLRAIREAAGAARGSQPRSGVVSAVGRSRESAEGAVAEGSTA